MRKLTTIMLFGIIATSGCAQGEVSQNDFRRVASAVGATGQELEGIVWHPGQNSARAEGPNIKGMAGRKRSEISLVMIQFPLRIRTIIKRKETLNPQLDSEERIEREARQVLLRTGLDRTGWVLERVHRGPTGGAEFAAGVVGANFHRMENGFYTSAGYLSVGMDSKDGRVVSLTYTRPQITHEPPPTALPTPASCLAAAKVHFAEWARSRNLTISPEKLAEIQAVNEPAAVHFQYIPVGDSESPSARVRSYKGSGRVPLVCNVNLTNYVVRLFADSLEPVTVFSFAGSSLPLLGPTNSEALPSPAEPRRSNAAPQQPATGKPSTGLAATAGLTIAAALAVLWWAKKRKQLNAR